MYIVYWKAGRSKRNRKPAKCGLSAVYDEVMDMWSITKVTDEQDWFERYVRLALSVTPPSLPAKRHRLGATLIQWHQCEPGVAFIDARGGTSSDRALATEYMKAMLAGHGFRQAQYEVDYEGALEPPHLCPDCGHVVEPYMHCPGCGARYFPPTTPSTPQGAQHPDPWMDSEPGSLTLPEHWGATKTAKWSDIMAKAKRLIQTGKVQLLRNGAQNVVASVIGDHGTYQTEFSRDDPNSQSMTQWQCDCPWDQYAWQRTRQWKKYEGRPCAHVLATWWASQAHPVDEEAHPAQQQMPMRGQQPQTFPGPAFHPSDPFLQPQPMAPQPQQMQMAMPGQAVGTPPIPGLPPEVLPPFPMEGQLEPQEPVVSIPGAKPQSPLNPVHWPGGTFSSVQEWEWEPVVKIAEGFGNSTMVEIIGTDMGVAEGPDPSNPMHGQYLDIKSNTRGLGEVMGEDTLPGVGQVVEVIFPLDKTGELQPYHIRAWLRPDQLRLRPDIQRPGPFIKRRR